MTTTCRPLLRVKLAGGADVTVVWANEAPVEITQQESNAATKLAAERFEGIIILCSPDPNGRGGKRDILYGSVDAWRHEAENAINLYLKIGHRPAPDYSGQLRQFRARQILETGRERYCVFSLPDWTS